MTQLAGAFLLGLGTITIPADADLGMIRVVSGCNGNISTAIKGWMSEGRLAVAAPLLEQW